jgi:hypothetical protein
MMMLAVMYGMMPRAKIEKLPKGAAGEQVEEAERTLRLHTLLELLHRIRVDARNSDCHAQPIQGDDEHDKKDLVPQIGDLEDILQVRQHSDSLVVSAVVMRISGW